MIDLLQICDSKAEFPGGCDVSRLSEEQIPGGIVKEHIAIRCDTARVVLP